MKMRAEQGNAENAYNKKTKRTYEHLSCYGASGWLFFKTGYAERIKDGLHMVGKFLSFLMLVWVWNIIWGMVPADILGGGDYDRASLVWYIAITEAIVFCGGYLFYDMFIDIKNGNFSPSLIRPVSYHYRMVANSFGRAMGQMTLFYPLALFSAYMITGFWQPSFGQIALSLVMVTQALFCFVCLNYMIGAAALWIEESAPAYWISQKLCFLLGGLLFPLTLYPEIFYKATQVMPFTAVFFMPGSTMLNVLPYSAMMMVVIQTFWALFFLGLSLIVHRCAVKRVSVMGG
jgi:ABC-2 type transport system permease protein